MLYLYMEQINHELTLPISSSSPCQASCVGSKTTLFMLATQCPGLCWTLNPFFVLFNLKIQLLMRDVPPPKKMPSREFPKGLLEWWLIMFLELTIRCSAASSSVTFSREMFLIPSQTPSTSCQALLIFFECRSCFNWLRLYKLQPCLWAVSCEQLGEFFLDRWETLFIPFTKKQILMAVMLIWIYSVDDW